MVLTPLTIALWAVALTCAALAVYGRVRGRTLLGLGIRRPPPWADLGRGAGIGLGAIAAVLVVEAALGAVSGVSVDLDTGTGAEALGFFVPFALFEELLLRCLLLVGVLVATRRSSAALVVSAVVFGLAHFPNPDATWLSLTSSTLGGVMYAVAFLRTGRVWLPLGLHLSWNLGQAVLGFPVSGIDDYSSMLVSQDQVGPWWVTGGVYGPEGGVVGIAARVLVIGLLMAVTRQRTPSRLLLTRADRQTVAAEPVPGQVG